MNDTMGSMVILAVALAVTLPVTALAHETDQFSNRAEPLADSTSALNRKVNEVIFAVAVNHHRSDDTVANGDLPWPGSYSRIPSSPIRNE